MKKQRVLIVCSGNSARSQMAEALIRHEAGDRFEVFSAGTQPTQVRVEAVAVMRELGIDISANDRNLCRSSSGRPSISSSLSVTGREKSVLCSREPESLHWPFEDPAAFTDVGEGRLQAFRRLRDRIHARVMVFLGEGSYGSRERS